MLASHEFGIAHPPGYPLLTLIGYWWSFIPLQWFGISFPFQMNIFISFISSLTNVLLFYFVKYLTSHNIPSLMAMFGFGFAPHLWEIAYSYEALPVNNCIILLILLSYMHYQSDQNGMNKKKWKIGKINISAEWFGNDQSASSYFYYFSSFD